mmetsp:Transcript_51545/g.95356  ORF Transcript_51545/g.95356 Transcript_51545/m.95356 type:complete len:543 (+) Transcript_51545:69-1697(+)
MTGVGMQVALLAERSKSLRQAFVAAVAAGVLRQLWRRWFRRPRGMPGTVHQHKLLGDLPALIQAISRREQCDLLCRWHEELGPTYRLSLPLQPWMVVTSDPANLEHILKTRFENYPKGPAMRGRMADLMGQGIFNADGELWHRQRKVASRMFTQTLFREHIWLVVQRNAKFLLRILESSDPTTPLDMFDLMNRFTLDTIGEVGFGKCLGALEDPSSPFLRSFDAAQRIVFRRFFTPMWRLVRFMGVGLEKETKEHLKRLDSYSRTVVRELQAGLSRDAAAKSSTGVAWADLEASKSFLGLFMEDAEHRGERLKEEFCRDLVLNFLIAGRDTTAQAISWTLYCLCTHPSVQVQVRAEVEEVCGIRGPAYDDVHRLPYLHAVLSEALRLYPSVPLDVKNVATDDVLPDGSFLPRDTMLVYDIYSMGRDTRIWGEDAKLFRPERWLEEDAPSNYHYPVFNAGPRECLGKRLAMVEMKACLATLLPHFSFELAIEPNAVLQDAQLTIGLARGLPCFVTRISEKLDSQSSAASTQAPSEAALHEEDI